MPAKDSKQLSNGEHNSRSNQWNHKACRKVTSLIFIIVWHWQGIHEIVDWEWWRLQERSHSSTDSYKMLQLSCFDCEDEEEFTFDVLDFSLSVVSESAVQVC